MAADEHLRRSFDALAARLRDEMSRHFEAASVDVAASIDADHARVVAEAADEHARALAQVAEEHEKAIEDARQAARQEAEQDAERTQLAAVEEAATAARERGREEGREEGRAQGLEQGRAEGHEEGRAEGREEGRAEGREEGRAEGREEGRVEGREEGRREGYQSREAEADNARRTEPVESAPAASENLLDAIRAMDRARSISEILDTLVNAAAREAARAGVVLVHDNHLRGWRFLGFAEEAGASADVDMPMVDHGIIGEAVRTATAVSDNGTAVFPIHVGGRVVAVLYTERGDRASGTGTSMLAVLELMARHAARSLEAVTAFRGAQVFADEHSPRTSLAGPPGEAEESARRYARLLISEIKLYHEPAVVAGRREGNLAERLAGEIARARVLYEQRVPAPVREARDYFHEELVSTLADGDAQLLANR